MTVRALQSQKQPAEEVWGLLKKNLGMGLLNLKRFLMMARHRPGVVGVAYTAVMLEKPLLSCALIVCRMRQGASNRVSCALHIRTIHPVTPTFCYACILLHRHLITCILLHNMMLHMHPEHMLFCITGPTLLLLRSIHSSGDRNCSARRLPSHHVNSMGE